MASHAYGGHSPGLAGKHHWGAGSVGIPGAQIVAGGYLDSSIDQTTEAADEFYGLITGIPSGLVLEEVGEDSGIVASSIPSNAVYAIPFDLYRWGVKLGSSTFSATFGTPAAGTNLSALTMTAGGSIGTASVTYQPPAGAAINLTASAMTGGSRIAAAAVTLPGAASANPIIGLNTLIDAGPTGLNTLIG